MKLIQEINEICTEINAILENYDFGSMEELMEVSAAAMGRAAEREFMQGAAGDKDITKPIGQSWRGREGGPRPMPKQREAEAGDHVQYQGKLFQLTGETPNGEFTSVEIRTKRPGPNFLPQMLSKFTPREGADGRRLWMQPGK